VTFPIAAENLPSSMYTPLVVLLVAYAALTLLASRAHGKEDRDRADRFETIAFAVLLVSALYTIVLVISAVFAYPSRSTDMVITIVVICAFFAALLFVFFLIAELIPRSLRRGRSDR
jgi:Na+/H+ antiporter NhaC